MFRIKVTCSNENWWMILEKLGQNTIIYQVRLAHLTFYNDVINKLLIFVQIHICMITIRDMEPNQRPFSAIIVDTIFLYKRIPCISVLVNLQRAHKYPQFNYQCTMLFLSSFSSCCTLYIWYLEFRLERLKTYEYHTIYRYITYFARSWFQNENKKAVYYKFELRYFFKEKSLCTVILDILNPFRNYRITISCWYRPIRATITK